ncbi:hypothetical protein [Limosilactobacillus reuteri]|uniref:hypothetical protein n=1 Tax=Limosilactobacillus reuteri TaxID=1598 RepID=UPI001E4E41C1|nr:hypothetical protein [Limosilactobacillus reuteri]UFK64849.1 hypothetical protein IU404_00182 [Limosilactobacillus reuteri]UFK68852.1 hypothetical protein IVR12_01951 [Limosilactobacillus reuteri]
MKARCGDWSTDVYPVEPFVYEVAADGKKEFYQSAWDAFSSELHMKNVTAKIIKIPVVPMSNDEIKAESVAFELGEKRHYPHVEEFTNSKPRRKVTFLQVAEAFAIITWIILIILIISTAFM